MPATTIVRDIEVLYPKFKTKILLLNDKLKEAKIPIYAFETLRSMDRCAELYAQGRKLIDGKWAIVDPKKIVTKSKPGQSYHNFGIAVDFVFDGDLKKDGIQWSWGDKLPWKEFGKIVRTIPGLRWGGDFHSFTDLPHVELATTKKVQDIFQIYQRGGSEAVWKELDKEFTS